MFVFEYYVLHIALQYSKKDYLLFLIKFFAVFVLLQSYYQNIKMKIFKGLDLLN